MVRPALAWPCRALSDRELDESFYEFGEGDLQKAMAGFSRARADAESGHLMTKQVGENFSDLRDELGHAVGGWWEPLTSWPVVSALLPSRLSAPCRAH